MNRNTNLIADYTGVGFTDLMWSGFTFNQGQLLANSVNGSIMINIGHLIQVRFNVRPEVTVFALKQAKFQMLQ